MSTITTDGVRLNYRDTAPPSAVTAPASRAGTSSLGGDATPVVLLHAFPFHSGMWEPQIRALSDRYRLIAPDLKGFGNSDAPDDRASYSMESYALELRALLDALGITSFVLCGLSMGGYVAFEFMRRWADSVRGLVLADTRAEPDPPEGKQRRSKQQEIAANEGVDGLIDTLSGALLSSSSNANKPDVVERVKKLMRNPPQGFIGALEAMKNRPDSSGDLDNIRVPTLIIVGENDSITPLDAARAMQARIPDARLVLIPSAGHISNLEAPDAFNGALGEFLDYLYDEGNIRR